MSARELAPAYDETFAYNPNGEWTQQHLMSINGKFDGVAKDDLLNLAARSSVPDAERQSFEYVSPSANGPVLLRRRMCKRRRSSGLVTFIQPADDPAAFLLPEVQPLALAS